MFPRTTRQPTPLPLSDRPTIPFQGPVEVKIRQSFARNFNDLAAYFRSEQFAHDVGDDLSVDNVDGAMGLIDERVQGVTDMFMQEYGGAIQPILNRFRQLGVEDITQFAKADGAGTSPSPVPPPRPRRRVVPTWMDQRPRKLFRLPARTYRGQPSLPNARDFHGGFDLAPITYINAAQYLPYDLIVRITAGQRAAIRQVIIDSITHGYDADLAGVMIANIVGLFPRWQRAVTNYYQGMLDNGAPARVAIRRANQYGDRLRAKRGIMIARTEIMRAQNFGRLDGWREQAAAGYFDADQSIKKWKAAPDACDECRRLSETTVTGADTPFDTQWGKIVMPPGHPHCRCTATIRPVFAR